MNVFSSTKARDPSKAHISSGKAVFHQREGTFLWCLWFKFEPDAISDVTSNPRWNWVGRSRSSLVFKQPTIYILSTPSIERWMMETNVRRTMSHLDANILILLRKWKYSFLKFQILKKSKIIFRLVYFLTQYQLLAILLLQKFRCEILNKLPNLDTTCKAKNTPPSTADERSAMFEIFFFFREGIVDSGARQRGK